MWEMVNKPSPSDDILTSMSRAQDKALGMLPPKSFFYTLGGPLNSICSNKDGSKIAAAGRNVFGVLNIEEGCFKEKMNLIVGRIKLNYSITSIQWHPLDDHILASSAGNGAVVVWDLNKPSKLKQDHVFQDHKRTVNKICFHPSETHLLMSGAHDGTINCFDIRRKCVALKFLGKSDSIRDVQFNPFDRNMFASACESGSVQLWDLRKPETFFAQYAAHYGPVFSLDWHLDDRFWLATGGRDKTVKVWDVQCRASPLHTVQTIAPVARIKWRPKERYHIASCSLVIDNNVSVWDIRRPYIPFAAFEEHKDVTTDILWQRDSDEILSCSKDSTIYLHSFHDAIRPADHAPPIGLGVSVNGDVCHAFANKSTQKLDSRKSVYRHSVPAAPTMPTYFKRHLVQGDDKVCTSTLKMHQALNLMSCDLLRELAVQYRFADQPLSDLCEHNAQISAKYGFSQKAQTWRILNILYSEPIVDTCGGVAMSTPSLAVSHGLFYSNTGPADSPVVFNGEQQTYDKSSEDGMDDAEVSPSVAKSDDILLQLGPELDAFFSDDQFDNHLFNGETMGDDTQEWAVPSEAFQPRFSIDERSVGIERVGESEGKGETAELRSSDASENGEDSDVEVAYLKPLVLPQWEFGSLVVETLKHFGEQGDVQMCVTILLVLGNRIKDAVDLALQEEWFLSYLDLLSRLQLWSIATEIIKKSYIPSVNMINQNSTRINTICGSCSKKLTDSSTYCTKCQKSMDPCSVCRLPVKGLFVWCQGCGHGGHLQHLMTWFQKHQQCPAGCTHKCEYS